MLTNSQKAGLMDGQEKAFNGWIKNYKRMIRELMMRTFSFLDELFFYVIKGYFSNSK